MPTFLSGSADADFEARIAAVEAPEAFLGAGIAADLTINYDTGATLLPALVGAVNTTNAVLNAVITRLMSMQTALETKGILSAS